MTTMNQEITTAQEIIARYHTAKKANDEEGMEAARRDHQEQDERIMAEGRTYYRVFEDVLEAAERGNQYLDLHDCIHEDKVPELVATLRKAGIDHFTYSSGWTDAVEIAWLFTKNGCRMEGMTEVKGDRNFDGSYEIRHGIIFSL